MIYFIRHSERLNFVDENKWTKSKRYRENNLDSPLTLNGMHIAKKSIKRILNKEKDMMPKYIYSSPATRCIETSIAMQQYIKEKYNVLPKIRIENGLVFYGKESINWYLSRDTSFGKNNYFEINYNNQIIDDKMTLKYYKTIYENAFDESYSSIIDRKVINSQVNIGNVLNTRLDCIIKLLKMCNHNMNLICCHGEILRLVSSYFNKRFNSNDIKYFGSNKWCSWIKIIDNKIVDTSNDRYNKKLIK